jgi:hypothetical protein
MLDSMAEVFENFTAINRIGSTYVPPFTQPLRFRDDIRSAILSAVVVGIDRNVRKSVDDGPAVAPNVKLA